MLVGIDSYSYHRLLGDLRAGEPDPGERLPDGGVAVVSEARRAGAEGVSLQTCYLGPATGCDTEALREAAGPMEVALAWGAPNGIEFGDSRDALAALLDWLEVAEKLGSTTMRIVLGGPSLRARAQRWRDAVEPLRRIAASAASHGIALAIENHGDLTAAQLEGVLEAVDEPALGVCFDTANALRVGDDVVDAARRLRSAIRIVHLKDVEPLDAVSDAVAGPCSVPYGQGVVPLAATLAAIGGVSFPGLACIELGQLGPDTDERELVAGGIRWLADYVAGESAVGALT